MKVKTGMNRQSKSLSFNMVFRLLIQIAKNERTENKRDNFRKTEYLNRKLNN